MKEEGKKEFIAEAEEILEVIGQNLMELDKGADLSSPKPEIINAIFRSAHTLKGMSGMVGLTVIAELSHKMEDLLDGLRMGRILSSQAVFDILFQGLDLLRELISQVSAGEEESCDISPVVQNIKNIMAPKEEAAAADPLESCGLDPDLLKVLTEYETHRLTVSLKSNLNLIEVKTRFSLENFDSELTAVNEMLGKNGEIIATLPDIVLTGGNTEMAFNLILATSMSTDETAAAAGGKAVEIVLLKEGRPAAPAPAPAAISAPPGSGSAVPPPAAPVPSSDSQQQAEPQQSIKSLSTTLRVEIENLDTLLNLVGELVMVKAVVSGIAKELLQEQGLSDILIELHKSTIALDRRVGELQEGLVAIRMVPVAQIFDRLTRIVRKTAKAVNKDINLQIVGEETKLDKSMIEDIADPLMHLVRNSIDHGIEPVELRIERGKTPSGNVKLTASQRGSSVVVEVEDDGGGLNKNRIRQKAIERGLLDPAKDYSDREIINQIFQPGFSTAAVVTEVSGRGVGLDVVAKNVAKLGGRVDVESEHEKWTRFTISLPITLVIIKALIVSTASEIFALPLNAVSESLIVESSEIHTIETKEVIRLRDQTLPLFYLDEIFCLPNKRRTPGESKYVVVVGIAEKRVGIVVDSIAGQQEIVIKSVGEILDKVPGIAGATELGNRRTILVLDVGELVEEAVR